MQNKSFIISNVFLLLLIAVSFYFHFSSRQELVYVDAGKLLEKYQGMVEARKQYQQKATSWQANIDTLTVGVQQAIKDYEKGSAGASAKERELSQQLIKTKQQQLMQYQEAIRQKAAQEDEQMMKGVLDKVNVYLKEYGQQHGYKIILAANSSGNIAYADESLDITDKVLEGLNKAYKGQ